MKNIICLLVIVLISCNQITEKSEVSKVETETDISNTNNVLEIYDFDGLEEYLNLDDGKVYVVNFWATWCAPCIKELPYFEKIGANYQSENVEVILISLDFPKQYETKLKPFISKHQLQSKVIALNDVDSNRWIPKVSENWSGAIPATLIYNKSKRQFYEQSFTYKELETELKQFLNKSL